MNQQKIGSFLKELRKENHLTQEQLAELLYVSSRTVSRWETGRNMPDLDILIALSEYYEIDLREIFNGERKSEKMDKELEETVLKVANYSNDEKIRLMRKLHLFAWIGVVSFLIAIALAAFNLTETGVTKYIASFCCGLSLGMLIVAVLYTSNLIYRFRTIKQRMFRQNH